MNNTNYSYNNEAIATVALGYFMSVKSEVELAKILFVLPFILHEPCLRKLKNSSNKRSLEEFIIKNPETMMGFNTRYFNYLPLSINSITILSETKIIEVVNDVLSFNGSSTFNPLNNPIGKRAKELFKGIDQLQDIMSSETSASFYLKLKITL